MLRCTNVNILYAALQHYQCPSNAEARIVGVVVEAEKDRSKPAPLNSALPWSQLGLEIIRRHLAGLTVLDQFVRNLLTVVQTADACPFNRRDVNEHIRAAVVGLNKAETLC